MSLALLSLSLFCPLSIPLVRQRVNAWSDQAEGDCGSALAEKKRRDGLV